MSTALKMSPQARSTEELESFFEALNRVQAVIEFNLDGTIINANENFLKTLGYDLHEIQGKHHRMFCEEDYANGLDYKNFWEQLNRGEFVTGEFKRLGKNGKNVWIIASYNPMFDVNGKLIKVVKFATDITSSKVELQVRTDIMNMTSIVSEANLKGDILNVNEKFLEVSKYSREELIGKGHNTTRHPDMPKEVFRDMWSTIGRGKMFRGVVKNLAKDGTPYYVDAVIAPIMGDNGKPKKYIGVRYDITETEIERQNMKGVINAIDSSFAYIEFDTKGNILKANNNFFKAMGYVENEIKGQHHKMFCDKEYVRTEEYSQLWKDLGEGKSKQGRFKRFDRSGKELWLQAVYAPVTDEMGRVIKVIKIATDITAQVELENAVKKKAEDDQRKVDCLLESVNKASQGDLTAEIVVSGSEAIDQLGLGVKKMISDLRGVISKVVASTHTFAQSTTDISSKSSSVAQGSQSLGATVEEMNASVEELTASIDLIAENTKSANQLAQATQKEAEIGSEALKRSIEAMELINKSSEDISEIIKVISEIASQTNLLAFNAAIEAARAGEHGLGFSVVADEVRKLAERSSQAAKEISKLISESVKRVQQGSDVSRQAGEAFQKIVVGVGKTGQSISEISCAAEEQSSAAKEVSTSIAQIAEETEKAAIASESIAHGSKELSKESQELSSIVMKFVV